MRCTLLAALIGVLAVPAAAVAHPERSTRYPDPNVGAVPALRTTGPGLVVCRNDTRARLRQIYRSHPRTLRSGLRMLKRCRYKEIQKAVDAARNGTRIFILPGVYREDSSRRVPIEPDACSHAKDGYWEQTGDSHGENGFVPTFRFQHDCPNARNLIAIIDRSNIQLQGTGKFARDTLIEGDRLKRDVIRADRADGVVITNLVAEQGASNDIDVVETNGFRLQKLVARWGQDDGVLTFTSDHGLY